jgi:hypothetical protein
MKREQAGQRKRHRSRLLRSVPLTPVENETGVNSITLDVRFFTPPPI